MPLATIEALAAYYNREFYPSSYTDSQGQQLQQENYLTKDSFKQGYIDMLREEEKLFTSLEKILVDEVIDQYISKTPSSLSMLPSDDKQQ